MFLAAGRCAPIILSSVALLQLRQSNSNNNNRTSSITLFVSVPSSLKKDSHLGRSNHPIVIRLEPSTYTVHTRPRFGDHVILVAVKAYYVYTMYILCRYTTVYVLYSIIHVSWEISPSQPRCHSTPSLALSPARGQFPVHPLQKKNTNHNRPSASIRLGHDPKIPHLHLRPLVPCLFRSPLLRDILWYRLWYIPCTY